MKALRFAPSVHGRCVICIIGFAVVSIVLAAAQNAESRQRVRLNKLIETLEKRQVAYSSEWQFLDMMRSPFLLDQLFVRLNDLRPANGRPPTVAPLVRIPMEGDEDFRWAVYQILDLGAFGIIFPLIETREQAIEAVQAMRYPQLRDSKYPEPRGRRQHGAGAPRAAEYWGLSNSEYRRRADVWPLNPDGELFAIVMIPTAEGIKNINEILQVPGIGGVLIGPGETAASLGVPTGSPEHEAAFQTILKACVANKVACGMSGVNDDTAAKKWISQGFNFLTGSSTPVWLR